jgi:nicotinamidase-related amidase
VFYTENSILILIDIQEKLTAVMHNREELVERLVTLTKGMQLLNVPIIRLEQNPAKMGATIPELNELLADTPPISKMSFSVTGCEAFMDALSITQRNNIIVAGIETHICVYQSCIQLAKRGYRIKVVADATSSRTETNRSTAIAEISTHPSAGITTTEMILFELMQTAEHSAFRDMLRIIK